MTDTDKQPTFFFHDHETFGTYPALDHPAQFVAIRADSEFNVIGGPEVFYCKPTDDYLLQPGAVLIIDIISQEARAKGESEAALVARIRSLFTVPKTYILGCNNARLDGEVTHNALYRNFYDSYVWGWRHDNSCWDLLDVMRAYYTLCPEGINWPENDGGLPSLRLEYLAKVSGIEHNNAHDAMADVYITIAMAKLVKTRQPRLFDHLLARHNKHKLMVLIDVPQTKPLVHVSGMFGAWHGNTSWVALLAWRPENRNAVITVGLAGDISPLLELDSDTLHERLYTAKVDLGDNAVVPVKLVHINKCPVLAQANMLRSEDADRLEINRQRCLDNLKILCENPQMREKVVAIFAEAEPFAPSDNVDAQLYNGFFSDADRAAMKVVLEIKPCNLSALDTTSVDKRTEKLLLNYRTCNFPGTLGYTEQQRWLEHCRQILTPELLQSYTEEAQMLAQQYADDKEKVVLLKVLWQYAEEIV